MSHLNTLQCDKCGRFIPIIDLCEGRATHRMITPDSEVSYEYFETLCRDHSEVQCTCDYDGGTRHNAIGCPIHSLPHW